MPRCKFCNREITSFDKDLCPYCGGKKPIDESYKTMDITRHIDPLSGEYKLYKSKSKNVAIVLCCLFGYFGAHDFYLLYNKRGILSLLCSLCFVGIVGSILTFCTPLSWFGFLVAFGLVWAAYLGFGISLLVRDSLKDGNGEFLR